MISADATGRCSWDALVVGGGFYGSAIACYLRQNRKLARVLLVEREAKLLSRASLNNQARVHNGYHYPRSFTTAFRSRVNLPRFAADYPGAVVRDFTKVYAIARHNSQVTCRHFERFCREIGARMQTAPDSIRALFEPRLIEGVFLVEEFAFDACKLREQAEVSLARNGVEVRLSTSVRSLESVAGGILAECASPSGETESIGARYVFNCTYSGLNQFRGDYPGTTAGLKHEVAELTLIRPPPALDGLGVTLMDGPFFSTMPYPARGLYSLSHVRYTPHNQWRDAPGVDPYERLAEGRVSRVDRMLRDAARYVPAMSQAEYVDSLYEIKTVLIKNEADDGRPILFERHASLPSCYSILGGKLDNIYDILEKLNGEQLSPN